MSVKYCPKCAGLRTPAALFQDGKYGYGYRVHNKGDQSSSCTICGNKVPHSRNSQSAALNQFRKETESVNSDGKEVGKRTKKENRNTKRR